MANDADFRGWNTVVGIRLREEGDGHLNLIRPIELRKYTGSTGAPPLAHRYFSSLLQRSSLQYLVTCSPGSNASMD
jgi:hypothetical protein